MLAGALAATLGATAAGPWTGVALAIAGGDGCSPAVFALVVIGARADQVIAGTAITLGAVGLTGTIYRQAYGAAGAGLDLPTLAPIPIPGLSALPVLGPALFSQPAPTYLGLLAVPAVWWLCSALAPVWHSARPASRRRWRARPACPRLVRCAATIVGGGFAGLAGATLVLAQVGTFAERMTAGAATWRSRSWCWGGGIRWASPSRRSRSARRWRCSSSFRHWARVPVSALSDAAVCARAAGAGGGGGAGARAGGLGERVGSSRAERGIGLPMRVSPDVLR